MAGVKDLDWLEAHGFSATTSGVWRHPCGVWASPAGDRKWTATWSPNLAHGRTPAEAVGKLMSVLVAYAHRYFDQADALKEIVEQ